MIGPLRYPPSSAEDLQSAPASVSTASASTHGAVLLHLLSEAVSSCSNMQEGCARLEQQRVGHRLMMLSKRPQEDTRGGGIAPPVADCAIAYELVVYSHVATLLGRQGLARTLLRGARGEAKTCRQALWQEYARGLEAVMAGRPFRSPDVGASCGLEQYWLVYLDLMEDLTTGRPIEESVGAVDRSFINRNADLHISQDWFGIEGSARAPVKWDFRRDAILLAYQQQATWPASRLTVLDLA